MSNAQPGRQILQAVPIFMMLALMLTAGCAPLCPYHTSLTRPGPTGAAEPVATRDACPRPGPDPALDPAADVVADATIGGDPDAGPPARVRFVEYDDFGNLFNRDQLDATVQAAQEVTRAGGIVVVYVHGWEHNAREGDRDLRKFRQAIRDARRIDQQYKGKRQILGIYVGWRGQSLRIPLVSKLTFWERKATAQSVGDGAVFELYRKLADLREDHPTSRLVIVGHSFGGAIAYASLSHSIMAQIIEDHRRRRAPGSTLNSSKRWDMVVLINPAFEAMQLRPHLELARAGVYQPNQLPHLILVTTMADGATRMAFPAGHYLRSTLNRYADKESASMYNNAVGHYLPYITHQLAVKEPCKNLPRNAGPGVAQDQLGQVVEARDFCFDDARAKLPANEGKERGESLARSVLLSRCDVEKNCRQVAGSHVMRAPPYMPIWNIRTTGEVMDGHGDIWNPTKHAFLVQLLIRIIEQGETATAQQR